VRNSGTTQQLFSIFGTSNGRHLWAAGMAGTILESDDGGKSWTTRRGGIDEWLYMIFGTSDGKRLWVVGDAGRVLESSDRGTTWAIRNSDPAESVITSIFGTSDGKRLWAVAAGGTILESNDGGDNWAARGSVAYGNAYSIFGTSDGQRLWAVGYSARLWSRTTAARAGRRRIAANQKSLTRSSGPATASIFGLSATTARFWSRTVDDPEESRAGRQRTGISLVKCHPALC